MCAASQSGRPASVTPRLEPHPVRLDVGLVHHVEAVLVGEFVPARHVGVVGRAHRVDVQLLHQADVLDHRRLVHHVRALGVVLVPVDAPQHDGLPVQRQDPVDDLDAPEAHPRRSRFRQTSPVGVHAPRSPARYSDGVSAVQWSECAATSETCPSPHGFTTQAEHPPPAPRGSSQCAIHRRGHSNSKVAPHAGPAGPPAPGWPDSP